MRKYPASIEASQARSILDRLDVQTVARPQALVSPDAAAEFERSHSSTSGHTKNLSSAPPASDSRLGQSRITEDWRSLVRRFLTLPHNKKKMLGIIVFVAIVFPGGIFVVSGLIIFYALQLALLKKHLNLLLDKVGSK
jgi:hypothetical protein